MTVAAIEHMDSLNPVEIAYAASSAEAR